MSLPAVAQTPPTQGWPANRPPAQPSTTPQVPTQQAPTLAPGTPTPSVPAPGASIVPGTPAPSAPAGQAAAPGAGTPAAVPLPQWFVEIDTAKKGEVTRADFLKYRMKSFEELDANKDAKLSLDEFVKVAEPPFSSDVQGGPNLEERRTRAKAEFQNLDTNRDGFVERGEAEALVHAEFNNYDTDRDNKVTEPEVRLIIQRSLARDAQARQEADQRRRQGMAAINDFIDSQLREADKLDKNGDGKVSQQEYLVLTGPADGPQAQGMLPYEIRKQLVMRKFNEMDSNKDGQLDRVELTGHIARRDQTPLGVDGHGRGHVDGATDLHGLGVAKGLLVGVQMKGLGYSARRPRGFRLAARQPQDWQERDAPPGPQGVKLPSSTRAGVVHR